MDSELQTSWLASFVAVVEHGTFTAAARATVRSQPRVSAHVALLERTLGAQLLTRTSRGVQLTSAGRLFLPRAQAVLRELRQGGDEVAALGSQVQGSVRVGSYPGASAVIVAPLMQQSRVRYPGVRLDLFESVDPTELEAAVAHDEIDFAIRTSEVPQRHRGVPSELLCHEKIVLVTPQSRGLRIRTDNDLAQLREETVIVSGDPQSGWADYRDRLDRLGVTPRQMMTVTLPTTVVALVRAGVGVGILGAFAAHVTTTDPDLLITPLPTPTWQREIRIFHRSNAGTTAATRAFLDLLNDQAPQLTGSLASWERPPA